MEAVSEAYAATRAVLAELTGEEKRAWKYVFDSGRYVRPHADSRYDGSKPARSRIL